MLGLEVVPLVIQRAEDIPSAFEGLKTRADALMKSRRRIASPRGSKRGIVAGQTGTLEVVKTALRNVRLGQKQTSPHLQPMSALPPKADIGTQLRDVRFVPKADIPHCGEERRS